MFLPASTTTFKYFSIILRSAKVLRHNTKLTIGGGSEEHGFGGVRYGGKLGDLFYRGYGKYFDRDSTTLSSSSENASDPCVVVSRLTGRQP